MRRREITLMSKGLFICARKVTADNAGSSHSSFFFLFLVGSKHLYSLNHFSMQSPFQEKGFAFTN